MGEWEFLLPARSAQAGSPIPQFSTAYSLATAEFLRTELTFNSVGFDYAAVQSPYSHMADLYAAVRTESVACSLLLAEVMEAFGERYNVPKERQYTNDRGIIDKKH